MSWDDNNDAFETFMSQYDDLTILDEPSGYHWDADPANPYGIYSNWGEDTLSAMGADNDTAPQTKFGSFSDFIKSLGGVAKDTLTSKAGLAGLMALLSYLDRDKGQQYGGGTTQAYAGPSRPLTATTEQGKYGPIVRYAANGGLMQAYANGGKVQMEDGGFVMTKKAVDGAGGPRGIQQLVPGARMIGGPPDPTGRRDLTPAVIHGPKGVTPAKVSSGEAYVPKHVVDQHGGPDRMYAIMNKLQGRA
jgi:hypothetical protein